MIRFLLLAILIMLIARAFWRVMDGVIEAAGGRTRSSRPAGPRPVKLSRDPVCGTFVSPASAVSITRGSTTYHFCSDRCRDQFSAGGAGQRHSHAQV